jgi:hypothetical protein
MLSPSELKAIQIRINSIDQNDLARLALGDEYVMRRLLDHIQAQQEALRKAAAVLKEAQDDPMTPNHIAVSIDEALTALSPLL